MKGDTKEVKTTKRFCKTCGKETEQEKIANRSDLPSPRWFCWECFQNPDTVAK